MGNVVNPQIASTRHAETETGRGTSGQTTENTEYGVAEYLLLYAKAILHVRRPFRKDQLTRLSLLLEQSTLPRYGLPKLRFVGLLGHTLLVAICSADVLYP